MTSANFRECSLSYRMQLHGVYDTLLSSTFCLQSSDGLKTA